MSSEWDALQLVNYAPNATQVNVTVAGTSSNVAANVTTLTSASFWDTNSFHEPDKVGQPQLAMLISAPARIGTWSQGVLNSRLSIAQVCLLTPLSPGFGLPARVRRCWLGAHLCLMRQMH